MANHFVSDTYSVLVVDDDMMIRLTLVDLLYSADYEPIDVKNGSEALSKLKDPDVKIDIVLLDLDMPEMDGFEILSTMKADDKLKTIPVVVMATEKEKDLLAPCIEKGAKDYLMKPINMGKLKDLGKYITKVSDQVDQAEGDVTYKKIRSLGTGASGTVDLVQRQSDLKMFALKTVDMGRLSDKERKMAKNEVNLLRVLNGPSIIQYYESFEEKDVMKILMEYAEHGSLDDLIKDCKSVGNIIPKDRIMQWTAHAVLGLLVMHSKNVLHRDIKAQNMFLASNMVVKLGDFGISKTLSTNTSLAQTMIGTPYFMSPELINEEPYGQKSDIWALGCTVYELVTLKKPFDGKTSDQIFNKIKDNPYAPLGADVDPDIKTLIDTLLQKDPKQRPNIRKVANMPCLKSYIAEFLDTVPEYKESISFAMNEMSLTEQKEESNVGSEETKGGSGKGGPMTGNKDEAVSEEQMKRYSKMMRRDVHIQDYKIGWFKSIEKCVKGDELYYWLRKKVTDSNEEKIENLLNEMITQGLIHQIEPIPTEDDPFDSDYYYRFQQDTPNRAANMGYSPDPDSSESALELSKKLVQQISTFYSKYTKETAEGDLTIQTELFRGTSDLSAVEQLSAQLQSVDLDEMNSQETTCFFLNVFQVMFVHCLISGEDELEASGGVLSKLTSILAVKKTTVMDTFFYSIGGLHFSLNEIKHGVLRGNKKNPECYFKYFGRSDPRANLLPNSFDRRYHLVLYDIGEMPESLVAFEPDTLNEKLDKLCVEFANSQIQLDYEQELVLPKFLQTYKDDIASNEEEMLRWIFRHAENPPISLKKVLRGLQSKNLVIRYV